MFPTWSDWNLKYTKKGLVKRRAKMTISYLAIFSAVYALIYLRRNGKALNDFKVILKEYVRLALLSGVNLLQMIEKRIV